MMIYKIFRSDEWHVLRAKGDTAGAPIDLVDGYIHFSTAIQAQELPINILQLWKASTLSLIHI